MAKISPIEKIRDGFLAHLGTAAALVVTGLIGWLFLQIAPALLPAIELAISSRVMLALLLLSLLVNILLAIATWQLSRKRETLKLRYGILWDKEKNPHCPVCKNPGLRYAQWSHGGSFGYRCNPCNKVYTLCDASGKAVEPEVAISEL